MAERIAAVSNNIACTDDERVQVGNRGMLPGQWETSNCHFGLVLKAGRKLAIIKNKSS